MAPQKKASCATDSGETTGWTQIPTIHLRTFSSVASNPSAVPKKGALCACVLGHVLEPLVVRVCTTMRAFKKTIGTAPSVLRIPLHANVCKRQNASWRGLRMQYDAKLHFVFWRQLQNLLANIARFDHDKIVYDSLFQIQQTHSPWADRTWPNASQKSIKSGSLTSETSMVIPERFTKTGVAIRQCCGKLERSGWRASQFVQDQ